MNTNAWNHAAMRNIINFTNWPEGLLCNNICSILVANKCNLMWGCLKASISWFHEAAGCFCNHNRNISVQHWSRSDLFSAFIFFNSSISLKSSNSIPKSYHFKQTEPLTYRFKYFGEGFWWPINYQTIQRNAYALWYNSQ